MSTKAVMSILIIAVVAAVLLLGYILTRSDNTRRSTYNIDEQVLTATVFNQPRGVVEFDLVDSKGNAFTRDSLHGQWTLFFFGFSNCTAICPIVLPELRHTFQELDADPQVPKVQMIMVTVDPARDTVEELDRYMTGFYHSFLGVTGGEEELAKLRESFGIMAMDPYDDHTQHRMMMDDPEFNYQVQHSGSLILVGPDANWYATFSMPHIGPDIARDLRTITRYYQ